MELLSVFESYWKNFEDPSYEYKDWNSSNCERFLEIFAFREVFNWKGNNLSKGTKNLIIG